MFYVYDYMLCQIHNKYSIANLITLHEAVIVHNFQRISNVIEEPYNATITMSNVDNKLPLSKF